VRRVLLGVLLLCTLAACSHPAEHKASPLPTPADLPAEAAGGSCQLLNFGEITTDLGLTFDIAAASQQKDTYTCVLEKEGAPLPDLTFSITLVSALDVNTFKAKVVPKGATVITDLGKIGYSRTLPAAAGVGPTAEVGWLAGNGRLIILSTRLTATSTPDDATALVPKLVVLARRIDLTSI
jgi:hypothetical protein